MATRWIRCWSAIASAIAGASLLGVMGASCNLVAGLDKIKIVGEGGEGGALPCNVDAACDDQNPCTADSCGPDKVCVFTPLDGVPAPDAAQTAGDCQTLQCVAGKPESVPEDGDVPDDGEDCTVEACAGGVAQRDPKPDGTTCDKMGMAGTCDAGKCTAECVVASDCANTNPCVVASCDAAMGKCVLTPVADGTMTPGATQPPGDCHTHICVAGMDVDEVDDSDVPVTATDCDTEVCTNGTPSNPAKAEGTGCSTYLTSQPGFCDGAGTCAECTKDAECPGVSDDCKHPACVNFACTTAFTPDMTPVTAQTPGDCHEVVCDGAGGTKDTVDDTDTPVDGTVCTNDLCNNGVPSHTFNPGVKCEAATSPFVCNATGQCGCQNNGDCIAPNTCGGGNPGTAGVCGCTKTTCAAQSKTCGSVSDGCFGMLSCNNNVKNGGETDVDCGGPTSGCATRCANGKTCNVGSDCASGFCVDGVCCNTACMGTCAACSAAKKGQGTDGTCGAIKAGNDPDTECSDQGAMSCGTNGACDGAGACQLYGNTTTCQAASCADMTTLTKARTCNGTGTCVTPVPATQSCAPYLCASGACTTLCVNDGQCAAGNYCSGGMCLPKKSQGMACTAVNQCLSGFCVDGVCCSTACNTPCQACAAALKQSAAGSGTCGNARNNQADPRGSCATTPQSTCGNDGLCQSGACEKWPSGTVCVAASCAGNAFTAPTTCDGGGQCNVAGGTMTCANNFACDGAGTACQTACGGADPMGDVNCAGGYYCDGMGGGACQLKHFSGAFCFRDGECFSGFCVGNFCN